MTLADFCPYVQSFTWRTNGAAARGTMCDNESNSPASKNNYALEKYGKNSKCFEQASQWEQRSCR